MQTYDFKLRGLFSSSLTLGFLPLAFSQCYQLKQEHEASDAYKLEICNGCLETIEMLEKG